MQEPRVHYRIIMINCPVHGLLVVDKPPGLTSREVVNRVQRRFPPGTPVGHTGTLDPIATGVLVVCLGKATRLAEFVQRLEKTYRAGLRLGAQSDTDDAEGVIQSCPVERPPVRDEIERSLQGFLGEIEQVPPAFSAAKVSGQRAYALARRGQQVSLEPRRVRIHAIDVLRYEYPRLDIEVHCGQGTYIRSLARDLGERLGCGALVETLRRTRVGPFTLSNALSVDIDPAAALSRLLPVAAAVSALPRLELGGVELNRLRHGGSVSLSDAPALGEAAAEVAVFDAAGDLAVIAVLERQTRVLRPVKVLSCA